MPGGAGIRHSASPALGRAIIHGISVAGGSLFADKIKKVVDHVDGGVGGVIMGLDGIAVERYMAADKLDVTTIGMEFSFILTQVKKAGEILQIGDLSEFTVKAEQLVLVVRMLSDEYFLAIVLKANGNYGKCRFMMRVVAPQIIAEL